MECPNCSFQNMPGLKRCVRCAGALDFSGVDYLPPRASGAAAVRATRGALARTGFGLRQRLATTRARARAAFDMHVDWPTVFWSVIPGLGHIRARHRHLGWTLLGAWATLLLATLLSAGSSIAWLWYLMMVGLHCFVITLLLSHPLQFLKIPIRMLIGLLIYAALTAFIYLPARWTLSNIVQPVQMNGLRGNDAVRNGDVILCLGDWLRPKEWNRGDIVLYQIEQHNMQGFIVAAGYGLDRIVGVPGDRVQVRDGQLLVNGEVVPRTLQPLGGAEFIGDEFDFHVRPGQYIILPSTLGIVAAGNVQAQRRQLLERVSRVRSEQVEGKAILRLRPWASFGRLRTVDDQQAKGGT